MNHLLRRTGTALALLWLVCTLTFVLVHSAPGDAALLLLPPEADAATLARLRADLGLDAPLLQQYLHWLGNIARGDLGTSLATGRPVREAIAAALPISLALGAASLLLTVVMGVTLGSAQARRAGQRSDTALTILSTTLYSAPTFWLSLAAVATVTVGAAALGIPPGVAPAGVRASRSRRAVGERCDPGHAAPRGAAGARADGDRCRGRGTLRSVGDDRGGAW